MAKSKSSAKPKMMKFAPIVAVIVVLGVIALSAAYFLTRESDSDSNDEVANAPVGCPKSTSVTVKSKEAGTQKISTVNSNLIHWRKDQAMLIFTNYTLNPDSVYSDIIGDRVLAVVKLTHKDSSTLNIGTYKKATTVATDTLNLYAPEFNISTAGLAGGVFDNNAKVEVTYFGNDYVCGTVTSNDGSSSISGQFIAKYIDKL
jgi:hypothetical protein